MEEKRRCWLYQRGQLPYLEAWRWQKELVEQRRRNPALDDVLILLEHPPVYTLGTGSNPDFVGVCGSQLSYPLYRVERGGEVTHHCPGQLIGYPIINLRHHRQDLHWYLRQLEEVLIRVLDDYGLSANRESGYTGVWVDGHKVAAIGIKVTRWIAMHGFSLNVCPDLSGFAEIVPCGIADRPVGSLAQWIGEISPTQVRHRVARHFAAVFDMQLVSPSFSSDNR
jgi:lipoyl(octanoyl) transferase